MFMVIVVAPLELSPIEFRTPLGGIYYAILSVVILIS